MRWKACYACRNRSDDIYFICCVLFARASITFCSAFVTATVCRMYHENDDIFRWIKQQRILNNLFGISVASHFYRSLLVLGTQRVRLYFTIHFGCSLVFPCLIADFLILLRLSDSIALFVFALCRCVCLRFHLNEAITLSAVQWRNLQCRLVAVNKFDLINNNRITIIITMIIRNDDWIGRMARADSDLITRASIFGHIDSESSKSKFPFLPSFFLLLVWSPDVIHQHHFPMSLTASWLERHLYHFGRCQQMRAIRRVDFNSVSSQEPHSITVWRDAMCAKS